MHCHPRTNIGLCADPGAVLEGDGLDDEVEGRFLVVVVASEEHGSLGEATIGADLHRGEVIDPDVLPYPAVVSDLQEPGVFDIHRWVDADAVADFGAEQTK